MVKKTEGKVNLFGLKFTTDEKMNFWFNRTEATWKNIAVPMSVEGNMQINDLKKQFNFSNL